MSTCVIDLVCCIEMRLQKKACLLHFLPAIGYSNNSTSDGHAVSALKVLCRIKHLSIFGNSKCNSGTPRMPSSIRSLGPIVGYES